MEIILIILTSTLLSAGFLVSYRMGYNDAKSKKDPDSLEINRHNARMMKEYANFVSYSGEERGN